MKVGHKNFPQSQVQVIAAVLGLLLALLPAFVKGLCVPHADDQVAIERNVTTSDHHDHHHDEHANGHDSSPDADKSCCSDQFQVNATLREGLTKRILPENFSFQAIFARELTVVMPTAFKPVVHSGTSPPGVSSLPLYTRYATFLI